MPLVFTQEDFLVSSKFEVNLIEFSSYNKPFIMTYFNDKQIVRSSGYMEECHLKDQRPLIHVS